ncbi:MAG: phosphoribosylaminoimidazolesuccinocarboxamide synthase [Pseudomonadota bacterium]|nr:phosphoribosylaminoimidazolesuccinocarboxamide synthase [Pseudomonadota bacterium]
MTLAPTTILYEGKAKQVYATADADWVVLRFKDDATAFNGVKKASIGDKGAINCRISAHLLTLVAEAGVPTAFAKVLNGRDQLFRRVEIVPVEVVVRNVVAGGFAKKLGRAEGERLARPIVEHFYKSDALNDPQINEDAAIVMGWASAWELACMRERALQVNDVLKAFWDARGIDLIDFKLEFGRAGGAILLADEITPDGSRLWERGTGRHLDKDVFRRDLGDLGDTYRELYQRVFGTEYRAE